jgi:hypothetical protein
MARVLQSRLAMDELYSPEQLLRTNKQLRARLDAKELEARAFTQKLANVTPLLTRTRTHARTRVHAHTQAANAMRLTIRTIARLRCDLPALAHSRSGSRLE